jgi:ABC-type transporter Mla maintaining outer membrane lipid asymmetry ATPase subunit MlaF
VSRVIEIERLRKHYVSLRPLRVESLAVNAGQRVAVTGIDAAGAEVFVNLLTGAALPDEGTIRILGRDTSAIANADEWLAALDAFGIVSARAGLVGEMTAAQNLALAFTLSVDPIPGDTLAGVRRLSVEAGVPLDQLDRRAGEVAPEVTARCHLARALAAEPALLLLEHANALTAPADAAAFGRDVARVAAGRRLAVLAITADDSFAHAVADAVYAVEAATGRLVRRSGWRRWFA